MWYRKWTAGLLAALVLLLAAPAPADGSAPAEASAGLPALYIVTEGGELPGGDDMRATLTICQQDGSRQTVPVEINVRGNTSRRFPKKSYRIQILDDQGEKQNLSIAGLRSDDDWILNPMYTDASKIRESLAYDLWERINSCGSAAASSRVAYVEAYINGEYWGLYGLQERIDRKQVDGDKRSGILYKIAAIEPPTVQELLDCTSSEACQGFELEFAGEDVAHAWEPAAAYMAFLSGKTCSVQARLSVANTIDYGLWAMLTQAHDCCFKNQFLNCVYEADGYTMYKIPWDLNDTFGHIWLDDSKATNYTGYHLEVLVMDSAFEALVNSGDEEVYRAIQERWAQLRGSIATEENLIAMAYAWYTPLCAAMERDSARWPDSGMGNGNAADILDIENYIRKTLPRMDRFIAALGAEE